MKPLLSSSLLAQSHKAQVANILKKQQSGKTITAREERILLAASSGVPEVKARDYDHLGISERQIYEFMTVGRDNNDPFPIGEPKQIIPWHDRLRQAGAFKRRLGTKIRSKIAVYLRKESGGTIAVGDVTPEEYQGLEQELQYLRQRVSQLRSDRDKAYCAGDIESGDTQDLRYREVFQELTIAEKRIVEVLEKRKDLVLRSDVEQDLAPRIAGIVVGGMYLYPRIAPQLDAILDAKERANAWKEIWREHCVAIMSAAYAPEFIKGMSAAAWKECAEWLEAKHKG